MLDQFRAHGLASRVQPFVSTQSSTTEWSSRGRMRVLIADDHRLIIEGVKTKLEELDNDVEFVEAMTVAELHAQLDSTPLRSEEHTSELQSLMRISYAVFCLKKKIRKT